MLWLIEVAHALCRNHSADAWSVSLTRHPVFEYSGLVVLSKTSSHLMRDVKPLETQRGARMQIERAD